MGAVFRKIYSFFSAEPDIEFRLQMTGIQHAGKSTILAKMKESEGKPDETGGKLAHPDITVGCRLEKFKLGNLTV